MGAVAALVSLTQFAQEIQRVAHQLLQVIQQGWQDRVPLRVGQVSQGRVHMISGEHQLPIHQLSQTRWLVGALGLIAPTERLAQAHHGRQELAQL